MAKNMIPYGRQQISEEDIQAVTDVLRSDYLTQGALVPEFEDAVSKYCGARYAVAANSATSALHLACLALGVGPGDRVWTSPVTFVASANCALYCGAQIDFVDVEPGTGNLSFSALEAKLAGAEITGQLPSVLIAVHLAGLSCDMVQIHQLSLQYGFRIIEDASHALGGSYLDHKVGCGQFSDITVFSFHPVKMITTGEGGMALTNSAELAKQMRLLCSHGIERSAERLNSDAPGGWYYEQQLLGFNYRMTELQAALGCSQIRRLDCFVEARQRLAESYREQLTGLPLTAQEQNTDSHSSYHLFMILLSDRSPVDRDALFLKLRERGIGVQVHYIPVHTQPYYKALGFDWGQFPAAEHFYRSVLSLPLHPGLSEAEQQQVVGQLRGVL